MRLFDRYTSIFWNENISPVSAHLYEELRQRNWSAADLRVKGDKSCWLEVDAVQREQIIKAFIISSALKQSIGSVFLSLLNSSLGLEQVAEKAMISKMGARLTGEHLKLASNIIFDLNEMPAIDKCVREVRENEGFDALLDNLEVFFQGMVGWSTIYRTGTGDLDSSFNEMNYHIWKALVVSSIVLELAETLPMIFLYNAMEEKELPNLLISSQIVAKDISVITSYLSASANKRYNLLPGTVKEVANGWLKLHIDQTILAPWHEAVASGRLDKNIKEQIEELINYNISKSLAKLNIFSKNKTTEMPKLIEKYLFTNMYEQEERRAGFWPPRPKTCG